MLAMKNKTYSIREACTLTGISRAWIAKQCLAGFVGKRMDIPFHPGFVYTLSESDIKKLKENTVIRKSSKN